MERSESLRLVPRGFDPAGRRFFEDVIDERGWAASRFSRVLAVFAFDVRFQTGSAAVPPLRFAFMVFEEARASIFRFPDATFLSRLPLRAEARLLADFANFFLRGFEIRDFFKTASAVRPS